MKTKVIISVIVILIGLSAFTSHTINTKKQNQNSDFVASDTISNNPKIDIKVNKEYDKNGNMLRYDSSYSYIYTYPNGKEQYLNMDSIFNNFRPYFFDHGMDIMLNPFNQFFDEDSFYQQHFFDPDFFMQQFENKQFRFEDMMKEMDSLRNRFLKELYPEYKDLQEINYKKDNNKKTIDI